MNCSQPLYIYEIVCKDHSQSSLFIHFMHIFLQRGKIGTHAIPQSSSENERNQKDFFKFISTVLLRLSKIFHTRPPPSIYICTTNWKSTHASNWSSVSPTKPVLTISTVRKHRLQMLPAPCFKNLPHKFHTAFETKYFNILPLPGNHNITPKLLPFPEMHFPSSLRISLRSFTLAVVTFTANRFSVSEI